MTPETGTHMCTDEPGGVLQYVGDGASGEFSVIPGQYYPPTL